MTYSSENKVDGIVLLIDLPQEFLNPKRKLHIDSTGANCL